MTGDAAAERCPGCGFRGAGEGPVHAYMPSSPACWRAFGLLQADELSRFVYPPAHGIVVDAYAASHGGDGSERRDRQSVAIHLIAICAVLEQSMRAEPRIALLRELGNRKLDWPALPRPAGFPALDHSSVAGADDLDDYDARARAWAQAVWDWWEPQHERVHEWLASPPGRAGAG